MSGLVEASEKPTPRLIINRTYPETIRRGDTLNTADVLGIRAIDLLGIVPKDERIITLTNNGQPIVLDDHTGAGAAFTSIARQIMGEDVPFPAISESGIAERLTCWLPLTPVQLCSTCKL